MVLNQAACPRAKIFFQIILLYQCGQSKDANLNDLKQKKHFRRDI